MVTITASDLDALLHLSSAVSNTNLERIIDQAIDMLNRCEPLLDLPNMTGTAGSKTLNVESRQRGAIFEVARIVYHNFYKTATIGGGGSESMSFAGATMSSSTSTLNDPAVMASVKEIAQDLVETQVYYG